MECFDPISAIIVMKKSKTSYSLKRPFTVKNKSKNNLFAIKRPVIQKLSLSKLKPKKKRGLS